MKQERISRGCAGLALSNSESQVPASAKNKRLKSRGCAEPPMSDSEICLPTPAFNNIIALDWGREKPTTGYDSKTGKSFSAAGGTEGFERYLDNLDKERGSCAGSSLSNSALEVPTPFLFILEPGCPRLELLIIKHGHSIVRALTHKTAAYRKELGRKKSDEDDPETLYLCYRAHPEFFREYREQDKKRAELMIWLQRAEVFKKEMIREKLRKIGYERDIAYVTVPEETKRALIESDDEIIKILGKKKSIVMKQVEKLINSLPDWSDFFQNIKGIGSLIVGGLIGLDVRRFEGMSGLKHYFGLIPGKYAGAKGKGRKRVIVNTSRFASTLMYWAMEGIIKAKDPIWYKLYKNMKEYYARKHSDWTLGQIDTNARMNVKQKLLCAYWNYANNGECAAACMSDSVNALPLSDELDDRGCAGCGSSDSVAIVPAPVLIKKSNKLEAKHDDRC